MGNVVFRDDEILTAAAHWRVERNGIGIEVLEDWSQTNS